jgi:hypothetical protein
VSCFGKILYVDEGSAQAAVDEHDAARPRPLHALLLHPDVCEAEAIGGVPRASWVGYEGQFAKPERWMKANHEPVAYLEAKAHVEGGNPPIRCCRCPGKSRGIRRFRT